MKRVIVCSAITLLLAACGGGGGSSSGTASNPVTPAPAPSEGQLSVGVGDGPVELADKIIVSFTGLELKPKEGDTLMIDPNEPLTIDLLDYQNGDRAMLIDNYSLAAGEYVWMRLKVDELNTVIEVEGQQFPLEIPSGAESGLKLNRSFTIGAGQVTDFTLDFDLRKSVVQTGNGVYKLRPTVRIVDNLSVGRIEGTVAQALITQCGADNGDNNDAGNVVYAFVGESVSPQDIQGNENDPVATATVRFEDDAYRFTVPFLPYDTYTLAFTCKAQTDVADQADDLDFSDTVTQVVDSASQSPILID
jgi:hypothetical protein